MIPFVSIWLEQATNFTDLLCRCENHNVKLNNKIECCWYSWQGYRQCRKKIVLWYWEAFI